MAAVLPAPLPKAFAEARAAGVILVASAGNENTDAPSFPCLPRGYFGFRNRIQSHPGASPILGKPWMWQHQEDTSVDASGISTRMAYSACPWMTPAEHRSRFSIHGWYLHGLPSYGWSGGADEIGLSWVDARSAGYPATKWEITDDLGSRGWDSQFGHGLINAYKAVLAAQNLAKGAQHL